MNINSMYQVYYVDKDGEEHEASKCHDEDHALETVLRLRCIKLRAFYRHLKDAPKKKFMSINKSGQMHLFDWNSVRKG
jgi:hypothetical protein